MTKTDTRADSLARIERGEARGEAFAEVLGAVMDKMSRKIEKEFRKRADRAALRSNHLHEFVVGDEPTPPVDTVGLFDVELWDEALQESEDLLAAAVIDEMSAIGVVGRITQPFVESVVLGHLAQVEAYGDSARAFVGTTINDALRKGATIDETAAALRGGPFSASSARMVARTEMISASNGGARVAYMAVAKPGDTFVWLSTPDDRTRPSHKAANGQQVGLDEPFNVGGESGMYPGDSAFSTAQRGNCRCTFYLDANDGRGSPHPDRTGFGDIDIPVDDLTEDFENSAMEHMVDGKFTPERQKIHDEIVAMHLKGVPVSKNPTFTMTGGGSAAGKSTALKSDIFQGGKPGSYVSVNADDIKELLPGKAAKMFEDGDPTWAAFVHEESSYLAKRIMEAARQTDRDYLLDGTGDGSVSGVLKKLTEASNAGYRVEGLYVTAPIEEALMRSAARGVKTGRVVPDHVIAGTHVNVSKIFPDITEHFEYLDVVSTHPEVKLLAKIRKGQVEIVDVDGYAEFLDKANWKPA